MRVLSAAAECRTCCGGRRSFLLAKLERSSALNRGEFCGSGVEGPEFSRVMQEIVPILAERRAIALSDAFFRPSAGPSCANVGAQLPAADASQVSQR